MQKKTNCTTQNEVNTMSTTSLFQQFELFENVNKVDKRSLQNLAFELCIRNHIKPQSSELITIFGRAANKDNHEAITYWVHKQYAVTEAANEDSFKEAINDRFEQELENLSLSQ
jgi:hypothetical protein